MIRHKTITRLLAALMPAMAAIGLTGCSDDQSYADLLRQENKDVNAFLANHRVVASIPKDTVFETGENAPYYQIDPEGNIFMQVIDPGNGMRAETGQIIYFRYTRYALSGYTSDEDLANSGSGNAGNMAAEAMSFRYNDFTLPSTVSLGEGIQIPLKFLPLNCYVNIVIKSQYGATDEIAAVVPYLYSVRYFKSQI